MKGQNFQQLLERNNPAKELAEQLTKENKELKKRIKLLTKENEKNERKLTHLNNLNALQNVQIFHKYSEHLNLYEKEIHNVLKDKSLYKTDKKFLTLVSPHIISFLKKKIELTGIYSNAYENVEEEIFSIQDSVEPSCKYVIEKFNSNKTEEISLLFQDINNKVEANSNRQILILYTILKAIEFPFLPEVHSSIKIIRSNLDFSYKEMKRIIFNSNFMSLLISIQNPKKLSNPTYDVVQRDSFWDLNYEISYHKKIEFPNYDLVSFDEVDEEGDHVEVDDRSLFISRSLMLNFHQFYDNQFDVLSTIAQVYHKETNAIKTIISNAQTLYNELVYSAITSSFEESVNTLREANIDSFLIDIFKKRQSQYAILELLNQFLLKPTHKSIQKNILESVFVEDHFSQQLLVGILLRGFHNCETTFGVIQEAIRFTL